MKQNQTNKDDSENQCQRLLKLTKEFRLFLSADGTPFLSYSVNNGAVYPINSKYVRRLLSNIFHKAYGQILDGKNIDRTIETLVFYAEQKNVREEVFIRIGRKKDTLYIDLCDENFSYIEVGAQKWEVKQGCPPVNFQRTSNMTPLPLPKRGGNIISLRQHLNLNSNREFQLFLAYLVGILFHGKQYPIAILQGPQGSAKSTMARIIKELVDPGSPELRSISSKEEDIFIGAKNTHLLCFDNLSGISSKLSDVLCKISTGGAISGRRLYSNDEEYFIELSRPVVINGIDDLTERPDLADRSLVFSLEKIDDKKRIQASKLWDEFQSKKPEYLGCLLDALVLAIRDRETINLSTKPRMVDFCLTACAGLQAFDFTPEETLQAFLDNRKDIAVDAIETNPIGKFIVFFMLKQTYWQGSVSEIISSIQSENYELFNLLPANNRNPSHFSKELRRISPALRIQGIEVSEKRTSKKRYLTLEKLASEPSLASQLCLAKSNANRNDINDANDTTDTNIQQSET